MAKVMITGASGGLGASLAERFAQRGDHLVIVARRQSYLERLQAELLTMDAASVEIRCADLADEEQVQALSLELADLGVDVLINNAALGHWDYTWDTTAETMRSMVALNVGAVAVLTAEFSKLRHQQSARLMNVASAAGYGLFDGAIPYSATKYFVTSLTEGLARELARQKHPMRAQLFAPRGIATDFGATSRTGSKMTFQDRDPGKIKIHTADEAAEFAMQLYDSEAVVGAVQRDMTFLLSDGLHNIGRF